jgi:hypothetical protein
MRETFYVRRSFTSMDGGSILKGSFQIEVIVITRLSILAVLFCAFALSARADTYPASFDLSSFEINPGIKAGTDLDFRKLPGEFVEIVFDHGFGDYAAKRTGAILTTGTFSDPTGNTVTIADISNPLAVTLEPSSLALLGTSLLGGFVTMRQRFIV